MNVSQSVSCVECRYMCIKNAHNNQNYNQNYTSECTLGKNFQWYKHHICSEFEPKENN